MKSKLLLQSVFICVLLSSCTTHRGAGLTEIEHELVHQIKNTTPVQTWGFKIREIRFSKDLQKALIIFTMPESGKLVEIVLENDGFQRYSGVMFDYGDKSLSRSDPFGGSLVISVDLKK